VHHQKEKTKDLPLLRKKPIVVFLAFKGKAGKAQEQQGPWNENLAPARYMPRQY